jgi:hypothetical protein
VRITEILKWFLEDNWGISNDCVRITGILKWFLEDNWGIQMIV